MFSILVAIHVAVALALILTVLLQTGKGAGMGAAFGGGSSGTVFGSRGPATFMGKVTAVVAILFMFTSLSLSLFRDRGVITESIMNEPAPAAQQEPQAPVVPEESVPGEEAEPIGE
jgi:preprotein translocase subunit SecG